jgi:DNA-3-methyladenine glycosylase II
MMRRIASGGDIAEGLAWLIGVEPRFESMARAAGSIPLRRAEGGFAGLTQVIVSQQVSVASARAIWGRIAARYPDLAHRHVRDASENDLRGCGLSGPKIRALRALADAVHEGRLDLDALERAPPEEVHARMTAVKGVGPWTADIYLLFHLGHADAFAPGDLALQEALRMGFGLPARPAAAELARIAADWSPWRGVAARLLWAYYAAAKAREGAPL